MFKREVISVDY